MAAQALYRKWRSQTLEQVVGQEHVTRTLRNALRDGRIAHAYLFTGPRGTGKTSTARILAKAVNCLNDQPQQRPDDICSICQAVTDGSLLDLIEIDAASNRGIDEIRDLRDRVHFSPSRARYKVYVIDEVHMLTPEAFNALLKTLEEPPAHVIFVLATTEPHKIPETVLSRCQRFDFWRIPARKITDHLAHILDQEGRAAEPAALELIARSADGSMRDAISLLDQLLSYGGELVTEGQVRAVRGVISSRAISELVDFMAAGDVAAGLVMLDQMVAEGIDLRQLTIQLVDHLRSVLLVGISGRQAGVDLVDLPPDLLAVVQVQASQLQTVAVTRAIRLFSQAGAEMRDSAQPQLCLELAWLEAIQPAAPAPSSTPVQPVASQSWPAQPADAASKPASAGAAQQPAAATAVTASSPQRQPAAKDSRLAQAAAPVPDEQVVDTLRANWTALLQMAEGAGGASLRGALRTLRHVVAHGNNIYFAFERDFAKTLVERPANKAQLQTLLAQLLGRPVSLHCQVGEKVTGVNPAESPASSSSAMREPQPAYGLDEDPVVEHARQHLGAVLNRTVE